MRGSISRDPCQGAATYPLPGYCTPPFGDPFKSTQFRLIWRRIAVGCRVAVDGGLDAVSVGFDLAQDSHVGVEKDETPLVQDQCLSVFSNACYALVQIITSYDGRSVLAGPVQ